MSPPKTIYVCRRFESSNESPSYGVRDNFVSISRPRLNTSPSPYFYRPASPNGNTPQSQKCTVSIDPADSIHVPWLLQVDEPTEKLVETSPLKTHRRAKIVFIGWECTRWIVRPEDNLLPFIRSGRCGYTWIASCAHTTRTYSSGASSHGQSGSKSLSLAT